MGGDAQKASMSSRPMNVSVLTQLESQLDGYRQIVEALERSGGLNELDRLFEETNDGLRAAPKTEQRRAVAVLASAAASRLLQHGISPQIVLEIEREIASNWLRILASRDAVQPLSIVLKRAVEEWETALKRERARTDKSRERSRLRWMGAIRLAMGTGAVVLDAANMLTVVPVNGFLFASVMGGGVWLSTGVEDIWKSRG